MRRMNKSKPCCVAVLVLTGLSLLMVAFTYPGGSGGSSKARWENYVHGDLDAFARFEDREEGPDLNRSQHNYQNFLERRRKELSSLIEKRKQKGIIKKYTSATVASKDNCVPFKTLKRNTRLCVHSKLFDPFISSHIRDTGSWEQDLLGAMVKVLRKNPDMHLVDLGCNVGAFTFQAAILGRRVVAIDPIRSNLFMLRSSLVYAGLQKNVTLLLNAVSDIADPVRVLVNRENLGGSRVEPAGDDVSEDDVIVDAITMDDLVRVVNFKKVFLKIDIEGYEPKALQRASKFFESFDVRYVLMEWLFLKHSKNGQVVIDFFTSRGFRPYADVMKKMPLSLEDYFLWPHNMIWIKKYKSKSNVNAKHKNGEPKYFH